MRKALVIPKAALCVLCLIISFVIAIPVLPVMSAKLFGGGTMDFNAEAYSSYHANRPVSGKIFCILGAASESEGSSSLGSYYYLVPVSGKAIDNKNKVDTLVLVKAKNGSDVYNGLNNIYRSSSSGDYTNGFEISGVLKKITEKEMDTAEDLQAATEFQNLELSEFTLDLTKAVKGMTVRFIISFVIFLVACFCAYLTIQAINKNAQIESIEDQRFAFKMEQEAKSGNTNEDGSDKMYGNSDASYGVTPKKDDGSEPATGGYNPTFQSQGGEQFTPREPTKYDESADEGGFFGGGAAQNGNFFGGSQQQDDQFFGGSQNNDSYYGGQDDGSFYGGGQDDGSFYGGGQDDGSFYGGGQDDGSFYGGGQGGGSFYGGDDGGFYGG